VPKFDELHEWLSFSDPDKDQTWLVDATFLRSNWECIYGNGCKGVLDDDATQLQQGCCSYGAHFIDKKDLATVRKSVKRLKPEHWQNHAKGTNGRWLTKERDGSDVTRRVNGACIFHNEPDFPGGMGCAFHIAALESNERPMDWKPDVCWQVPLRLEEYTEDDGHVVSFVREWKRRDWGEGGHDFHWWCTDDPAAFVGKKPVYQYLSDELKELVGEHIYKRIVLLLDEKRSVPLPHPQMKSKKKK
jgi:hypothetical protein